MAYHDLSMVYHLVSLKSMVYPWFIIIFIHVSHSHGHLAMNGGTPHWHSHMNQWKMFQSWWQFHPFFTPFLEFLWEWIEHNLTSANSTGKKPEFCSCDPRFWWYRPAFSEKPEAWSQHGTELFLPWDFCRDFQGELPHRTCHWLHSGRQGGPRWSFTVYLCPSPWIHCSDCQAIGATGLQFSTSTSYGALACLLFLVMFFYTFSSMNNEHQPRMGTEGLRALWWVWSWCLEPFLVKSVVETPISACRSWSPHLVEASWDLARRRGWGCDLVAAGPAQKWPGKRNELNGFCRWYGSRYIKMKTTSRTSYNHHITII